MQAGLLEVCVLMNDNYWAGGASWANSVRLLRHLESYKDETLACLCITWKSKTFRHVMDVALGLHCNTSGSVARSSGCGSGSPGLEVWLATSAVRCALLAKPEGVGSVAASADSAKQRATAAREELVRLRQSLEAPLLKLRCIAVNDAFSGRQARWKRA